MGGAVFFMIIFLGVLFYWNYRVWGKSAFEKINTVADRKKLESAPQELKNKIELLRYLISRNNIITYDNINQLNCIMMIKGYTSEGEKNVYFFKYNSEYYVYDTELHTGLPHFAVNTVALGNYNYHPSDIRYVGVSIGGISTGGFYDAGNYISKDYETTGKSQLWCKISNIEMTVDELLLNERLYDIASRDKKILPFINQYTKKIKLTHNTKTNYSNLFREAYRNAGYMAAKNIENKAFADTLLEQGEATYFRDWLIKNFEAY